MLTSSKSQSQIEKKQKHSNKQKKKKMKIGANQEGISEVLGGCYESQKGPVANFVWGTDFQEVRVT